MENKKTSILQDEDKFMVRMPDGMRTELKKLAEKNNRSLNAEIIQRLESSLFVPADISSACEEIQPLDRVDFAVKVLKRAGFKVTLPTDKCD